MTQTSQEAGGETESHSLPLNPLLIVAKPQSESCNLSQLLVPPTPWWSRSHENQTRTLTCCVPVTSYRELTATSVPWWHLRMAGDSPGYGFHAKSLNLRSEERMKYILERYPREKVGIKIMLIFLKGQASCIWTDDLWDYSQGKMRKDRLLRIYELRRGIFFLCVWESDIGKRPHFLSDPKRTRRPAGPVWVQSANVCREMSLNPPIASDFSFEFCSIPVTLSSLKGIASC